jgi:hypothetical protein
VTLAPREAGAAQGHALVDRHVVAHLGRLTDHDPHPMIDEQPPPDPGSRMDLHPRHRCRTERNDSRQQRHTGRKQRMRNAVSQERLHPSIRQEHLHPPHAPRGRVALLRGGEVLPNLSGEAGERAHGEKNGVLM